MSLPSPALVALGFFWALYGIVAAFALYRELLPAERELMAILGGAGVILVAITWVLLRRGRPRPSAEEDWR